MREYTVTLKQNKGSLSIKADNVTSDTSYTEYRFFNTSGKEPIMVAMVPKKRVMSIKSKESQ